MYRSVSLDLCVVTYEGIEIKGQGSQPALFFGISLILALVYLLVAACAHYLLLEFWYAIRARSYFPIIRGGKAADLKITIITRYNVQDQSTLILLKYRSYNDLTERLKRELTRNLEDFIQNPATSSLAVDPFALPLWHFNITVQYFRRAARLPRDAINQEEKKVHGSAVDLAEMNLQMLHLALGNLDQDKIQMACAIDTIRRLRAKHDLFYRLVKDEPNADRRGRVYHRVQEELDRYEHHLEYFKTLAEDVCGKGQRLLKLVGITFKLRSQPQLTRTVLEPPVEEDSRANTSAN